MTSKRHVVVDGHGVPLGLHLSSGNAADVSEAPAALATICVPRLRGRPRCRPRGLAADRGYDSRAFRQSLARRGIRHSIPRRRSPHRRQRGRPPLVHPALSANRWKVERFFAWLNGYRRLAVRYERYAFMYLALLQLAAAFITLRSLLQ